MVSHPLVTFVKEHHSLQNGLFQKHNISMVSFLPTTDSIKQIRFDQTSQKLFFNDSEVSVVYLRRGYDKKHFTETGSELEKLVVWSGKSMAINFPTIKTQILGLKHFQKICMMPDFQASIGMTSEELTMITHHSKEIKHIGIDFNWQKDKMLSFVEGDLDKWESLVVHFLMIHIIQYTEYRARLSKH